MNVLRAERKTTHNILQHEHTSMSHTRAFTASQPYEAPAFLTGSPVYDHSASNLPTAAPESITEIEIESIESITNIRYSSRVKQHM